MPVFVQQLRNLDGAPPLEAVKAMASHLRYIQEQLEYTLVNLDSSNIISIDTDETQLGGSAMAGLEKTVSSMSQTVSNLSSTVSNHGRSISELQDKMPEMLTASPAAAQSALAAESDLKAVVTAVNALVDALKASGIMEREVT